MQSDLTSQRVSYSENDSAYTQGWTGAVEVGADVEPAVSPRPKLPCPLIQAARLLPVPLSWAPSSLSLLLRAF